MGVTTVWLCAGCLLEITTALTLPPAHRFVCHFCGDSMTVIRNFTDCGDFRIEVNQSWP